MPDEREKTPKDVERALADLDERAKTLEDDLERAEEKHPPKPDHANDGGVI